MLIVIASPVDAAQEEGPRISTAAAISELKSLIREDLLAVRRARYALKRAREAADVQKIAAGEELLRQAKARLKEHRVRLRQTIAPFPAQRRRRKTHEDP